MLSQKPFVLGKVALLAVMLLLLIVVAPTDLLNASANIIVVNRNLADGCQEAEPAIDCSDKNTMADDIGTANWKSQARGGIVSSPALNANASYLYYTVDTETGSELVALNASNGSIIWTFPSSRHNASSPVLGTDGTIYFAAGSHLYAVRPDGTFRWGLFAVNNSIWGNTPTLGLDGTVYIISQGGECKLYAFDPIRTSIKWELTLGTTNCKAYDPIVGADGTIYALYGADYPNAVARIFAVRSSGTLLWTYNVNLLGTGLLTAPIFSSFNQIIFMAGNQLRGINVVTGALAWTRVFPFSTNGCASLTMGSDGTIYIIDDQGVLNATLGNVVKWSVAIKGNCSTPALAQNNLLYVGSLDDNLYTVSTTSGAILGSFVTGGDLESSPTMGGDAIYVGSRDGYMYAMASLYDVLDVGAWPKYRRDIANTGHN